MDQIGLQTTSLTKAAGNKEGSLSLQKGQVFEGRINKFFPNQTAALQLGRMNVTARLEAALNAGESYFFQVQQNDGIPRLQVLEAENAAVKSSSPAQAESAKVLQALGLEENRTNLAMLRYFQAEQLPFSKEMIQEGGAVLKQANAMNAEGIRLLAAMNQSNFPLTLETFQSLDAAENGKSYHSLMQQLQTSLEHVNTAAVSSEAVSAAAKLKQTVTETIAQTTLGEVRNDNQQQLARLLQLSASSKAPKAVADGALSLLQKADIMPANANSQQWLASFKEAVIHADNRSAVEQVWPQLFSGQNGRTLSGMDGQELFQTLMNRLSLAGGQAGRAQLQQLFSLFHQAGESGREMEVSAARLQQLMQTMQTSPMNGTERQALSVLYQGSFANETASASSGLSQTAGQLSQLLQQLGLHHETQITQQQSAFTAGTGTDASLQDSLKQSLLQHTAQLPPAVKDSADALLHKISGQQLLSQVQNGSLHQTAVQLPLTLGGYQTDLTVQWEGKKQKDGTLHPDHCRILFYLDMEQLGETIADVQIQNRVVTVNVFNEKEKPEKLMELLQPYLKERLEQQNYQLNAVHWKHVGDSTKSIKDVYESYAGFEGVDVRI